MSAQHKLRKYLTKIETAPIDKMDLYLEKVKKYKKIQTGGSFPWRDDMDPKVKSLDDVKKVKDNLQQLIDTHSGDIDKISESIKQLQESAGTTYDALDDALRYLNDIWKSINVGDLNTTGLDDILKGISGIKIDSSSRKTPTEQWNAIKSQQQAEPGTSASVAVPAAEATVEEKPAESEGEEKPEEK